MPVISFIINNVTISSNESISFGNNSQINISCRSVNSRPSVSLSIYDTSSNLIIPPVLFINKPNPIQLCDNNGICQTMLTVNLTVGFAAINKIKNIACMASNSTFPYNISKSISFALNFSGTLIFFQLYLKIQKLNFSSSK